ncbi:MAG: SipW-dependent-type signal peptide-containing protein [Bacilli bacterium]|nr:SipW-dependent-type signal peptide-containing protein [Bacilli bacterium]
MNKKIIAPIVSIAALAAVSIGTTYALFTDKKSAEVSILAGKVHVSMESSVNYALSRYEDAPPFDAIANAQTLLSEHTAVYENSNTADVTNVNENVMVTLDRMTPMDNISLGITATNSSNVNIKWRTIVELEGELIPALNIKFNGKDYSSSLTTHQEIVSKWSPVTDSSVTKLLDNAELYIAFPSHDDDGSFDNQFQEKTGSVKVRIEAIQGNAKTEDPHDVEFGFYDSYIEDEGLETEHWVHEIKTAEEFRNILDSSEHESKTGRLDYPGALDKDTVYLLKNDIDFSGAVWATPELIEDVNKYPFVGHLVGDGSGVKLSNVHVVNGTGVADKGIGGEGENAVNNTFCFFCRAANATFENLILDDCTINNAAADKCALLVAGNKTTEAEYQTELDDPDFRLEYIEFKNITVNSTCNLSGSDSVAPIAAVLRRYTKKINFENIVNNADVFGSKQSVAGILGQTSQCDGNTCMITFTNCVNNGEIKSGGHLAAGICSNFNNNHITVTNCVNNGAIKIMTVGNNQIGAIGSGFNAQTELINCSNTAYLYSKGSSVSECNVEKQNVCYDGLTRDQVIKANYVERFLRECTDPVVKVSLDTVPGKLDVSLEGTADHFSLNVSCVKDDVLMATNTVDATRCGSHSLFTVNNLSLDEVNGYSQITQLGYFTPGLAYDDIINNHYPRQDTFTKYLLGYENYGEEGYEPGYGVNSNGGYFIYDNTGATTYYQALGYFRQGIIYTVCAYDADNNVIAVGTARNQKWVAGQDYIIDVIPYVPEL